LTETDRFIDALHNCTGADVPESIVLDRGRLLDLMSDIQQYFHGLRVAVAGDPDNVISLVQFLTDLDMKPVYVVTGSPALRFDERIKQILGNQICGVVIKQNADLFDLHQWIKNKPVDLIIGNTYCKYIGRAENIPSVRFGFPILDRVSHRIFPTVGYLGAMRLIDKMIDAVLDKKDRECPEEYFELVQ